MNLFIIGNGFDLEHGLDTSYVDFRHYLENEDYEYLIWFEELYGFVVDSKREFVEDYLWKEFESKLYAINEDELVDNGKYIDMGLEGGDIGIEDTLDYYWEDQYGFIERLNDYIKLWIEQIDISVPKKTKMIKSNSNDMFITFNYTLLLERIYHVDEWNILHIHGSIGENDYSPVIGHGNSLKVDEARGHAKRAEDEMLEKETSIYNALANYYERILKDVNHYIGLNRAFFKKLGNIDQIFVIGNSLGEIDMPYFRKVKENIKKDAIWYIYYYRPSEEITFRNKIISIGVTEKNIRMLPSKQFFRE